MVPPKIINIILPPPFLSKHICFRLVPVFGSVLRRPFPSLSDRGQVLVRGARQAMAGLSPAPSVVLCSPLTRAIQTAIAIFGGTEVRERRL